MPCHRDEQAALYAFTDRLYRATSLRDVYGAALEAIRRALGCERGSILLFDDAGVMRFVAWTGLSEQYRRAVDGHSPWSRDVKDPQPICIADVEASDLPDPLKATVTAEGIAATAFIPLVVEGELVGKFMAYYPAPHAFGKDEIDLAVTIARQLGFSVQRVRSDEAGREAEHASRLLSAIVENSDDAIVSKDPNGIVTSWNQGAERVFGYTAAEMIGRPIATLFPPERLNEEADILERIQRGERVPGLCPSGWLHPLQCRTSHQVEEAPRQVAQRIMGGATYVCQSGQPGPAATNSCSRRPTSAARACPSLSV